MKYFDSSIKTLEQLKAAYRRLAKQHHPDHGGSTEAMQEINNEYTALFEILKDAHNAAADEKHQTTEAPEEFIYIINRLMQLDGLEIELCGWWLWIGGDTYKHRAALKEAGCKWSNSKKRWYWRHVEDSFGFHRGTASMAKIRSKYGSQLFTADGREQIRIAGATA